MSNLKDLINDPNIIWEKKISKNGKEYQIGYHKDAEILELSLEKKPFGVHVNWHPVDHFDADWISGESKYSITSISEYKLMDYGRDSPLFFQYALHFKNEAHYDFWFQDKSGDFYECDTYRNGEHCVCYNSDRPIIQYAIGK